MQVPDQLSGESIGRHAFGERAVSFEPGLDEKEMVLNFGPQHPACHGTLRMVMTLDGERVKRLEPEIGFLHTGFEKLGEYRTYNQFVVVTDRMNYLSAMANNIGFVCAVEELLGIEVPPRAQAIRVLMAEMSRISDHILGVGLQGMDLGAFTAMLWAFIQREKAYDVFELTSGGRLTTSYTRVGGLAFDLPEDVPYRCRDFIERLEPLLQEIEGMLSRNRIFLERTKGVGTFTREQCLAYGVTGPVARASGVNRDLRRDRPYLGYETYDFDIPVLTDGDVYARYLIRLAEARESAKIVTQVLDRMPKGEINAFGKVTLPDRDDVYTKMESLIQHFMLEMPGHGIKTPVGAVYHATESPNGELGWFIVSDGTGVPYKVRCRPPSLYQFQAIQPMAEGGLVADVVSNMSSLNVIAGELDR
ncbi:MAG: NADH-quinone oxidoreductase subunit D [Planctomycetota bacterium]|nr:MAG: NADH-quinone oxidoreductase subunit D [Planctomycetota bacterium]